MSQTIIIRLMLASWLLFAGVASAKDPTSQQAGLTGAVDVVIPAKPISSQQQLDAYIRDTPPDKSPLNWLSPDGRRRFLASLIFHERGLGGFSTDDLSYDLTRQQAFVLLQLFGEQSSAITLDARSTPRPAASKLSSGTLEKKYDDLVVAAGTGDHVAVEARYATDFAPLQTDAQRRELDHADMQLLFRATSRVADIASQPVYLEQLHADFVELERRHLIERPHAASYYDTLLRAHRSDEAQALLASQPVLDRHPTPSMRVGSRIHKGQPSLWVPSLSRRELVRFRFNIQAPSQIIVLGSTGCHFCVKAAHSLEADPMLRDIFRDYAQWVASSAEITAFDEVRDWNRRYPDMRLGISYDDRELPMVKQFVTPTFFFLDHGTVVDTVSGWPDEGNIEAIRKGLRKIHLLR